MSPAKLLGLPETEDSIIVRGGANASMRALPRAYVHIDAAVQDDDADQASRVLRNLIALRRRDKR